MSRRGFRELFEALTGREPYPWQERLYELFLAGRIPSALDLPTGLGKTSFIACWLCARLVRPDLPRRLIYVVDRRAVVDQASAEVAGIAQHLQAMINAGDQELALVLGLDPEPRTGKDAEPALPVSTLRGQMRDNRRWLEDPAAAAVVVGTVDMIGSRLLFSGYGVSRWSRPFHAGLIGVDSLVVLDEAHLAPPFEALLRGVARMIADEPGERPAALTPMRVTTLSATGREGGWAADVFRLERQDWDDPRTAARLNASKRLALLGEVAANQLDKVLASEAWGLRFGEDGAEPRRVLVFCNSRLTAQKVYDDLVKRCRKEAWGKAGERVALLVGERRFIERERLAGEPAFTRFLGGGAATPLDGAPAFLVATSAGEVGVDLDADDMVCDLVAWERMVQRLGRVNRRPAPPAPAEPAVARVRVIPVVGDKEAEEEVDAARLKALMAPFSVWPAGEDGTREASPAALIALKRDHEPLLKEASTPEPLRPPLTREAVDAWSLTSLEQHTGRPKIGPWLRGWVREEPQTRVVWRRWLPLGDGESDPTPSLKAYLKEYAPPRAVEALEAPSARVAKLLVDRAKDYLKPPRRPADEPDSEAQAAQAVEATGPQPRHPVVVVRLSSDGEVEHVYTIERLAGMKPDGLARELGFGTVVVDARLGGLAASGLLDGGAGELPLTASDLDDAYESAAKAEAAYRKRGWRVRPSDPPPVVDPAETPEHKAEREAAEAKRKRNDPWKASKFRWSSGGADADWRLLVSLWRGPGSWVGDFSITKQAQVLYAHHEETRKRASAIAKALQLEKPYGGMLEAAAAAHDWGKDRPLWQSGMGAPRDGGRPYAKTGGGGDGRALNGYRHELGSLHKVLDEPSRLAGVDDPELAELARHLILAHHGRGRPWVKPFDPDRLPARSAETAAAAALRFADLQARWGPWGLAWWEALLRAADQAASRANDALGPPPPGSDEADDDDDAEEGANG